MEVEPVTIRAQEVREALEHLYANLELANTLLAQCGRFVSPEATVLQHAQTLRNVLLDALETLRPLRPLPSHQGAANRSYEVLSLRYVSSLSIEEMADRLAVGTRQVYRDLRRAEEEMAVILQAMEAAPVGNAPATAFQAEVQALARWHDAVDLGDLLRSAIATVRALADAKQVTLYFVPPAPPLTVMVTPGIAKEMLIQILSALIQQSPYGHTLVIRTSRRDPQVEVRLTLPRAELARERSLLQNALVMAQLLDLTATMQPRSDGGQELMLTFPAAATHTLLVVEDNPGVCELYQRYFQGSAWRPVLLANPAETCARAQELRPAAIVLDVLMPEMDGWSVLQELRTTPEVAHIPVIICSVINDPELAQALGAAASLKKPVSRMELLEALDRATTGHSAAARDGGTGRSGSAPRFH